MSGKKANHFLTSKSKEIIFNISETFQQEEDSRSFIDRTAEVAGVSCSTVKRVRREKKDTGQLLSPKKAMKRGPYKPIDDFDMSAIRNKVVEFYTVRKQLPTLNNLLQTLQTDINFPGSRQTLWNLLHELGFAWKSTKDNRKVLIERPNIVALRINFYRRMQELIDLGYELIFIDETWIDTSYTPKKCWQSDDTSGVVAPMNRGQRIIVVHAGGRRGFVPGALLAYKATSRTGDYHSQMDGGNFMKWLQEKLIPNLDGPSAIVMDNSSYHSMQTNKCPSTNSKKADIQEWLRKQGVQFRPDMLRSELIQLVRANKPPPVYTVDDLIRSHGHEVLRLPPYHPDFNPIEMIWSQLKDLVRKSNMTFRYDDVLASTIHACSQIGTDRWRDVCDHVARHVQTCKTNDVVVDKEMDSLVIDLRDDSSDSSDE